MKSSSFWIAAILFGLAIYGFVAGAEKIADPGQPSDRWLPVWYLVGALIIAFNGYLSHRYYMAQKRRVEAPTEEKE